MAQVSFQYAVIQDQKVRQQVESQAKAIRGLLERSAAAVVDIGQRMQAVHDVLSPAMFRAWAECEFGWAHSTIVNYMQAARVFGECDCLKQIQPSAVVMLSRRNVPEKVIAQALELARSGGLVTMKRVQQLFADAGVQPASKTAGVARKPHTAAAAVAVAALNDDPVAALRQSLNTFTTNIDRLAESLSSDDRNALADQFLQLALQIRQIGPAAPVKPARKSSRKMAAV